MVDPHVKRVLLQLFAACGWLIGILLVWPHSRVAAVGLAVAGLAVVLLAYWRQPTSDPPQLSAAESEKQARFVVTQMLATLTRVQVAYLSQDFGSPEEGRSWLRTTLPRGYRPVLDQLLGDLEAQRGGGQPEGLKLARRILELKPEVERIEAALRAAHEARPDHAMASPVVFVVTEHIDVQSEAGTEPLVVTLASVDPTQPTLLCPVDTLSLFTAAEGGRREIRGHAEFDAARRALKLRRVDGSAEPPGTQDAPRVYAVPPLSLPEVEALELKLARPPLGFVVGASEMV